MNTNFLDYVNDMADILRNTVITDNKGNVLPQEEGMETLIDKCNAIAAAKGLFFFCGNGASATMAEHLSHDCFQNAGFLTMTCSETSHITAISNDIAYAEVFAYRINRVLCAADMLITISSSGNSPNIIRAVETAREKGAFITTFSGMKPDNKSRGMGDINIYAPAKTYGMVESAHATLLHCWLDLYLDKYMGGRH